MTYSTYFFEQAGLPTSQAFNLTVDQYGLAFVGTLLSWVLMSYLGRRTFYVTSLIILNTILLIIDMP